jgi:PhnB protein
MQLKPYLTFNGNCEEAFKFYQKTFKGKIKAMFPQGNRI